VTYTAKISAVEAKKSNFFLAVNRVNWAYVLGLVKLIKWNRSDSRVCVVPYSNYLHSRYGFKALS